LLELLYYKLVALKTVPIPTKGTIYADIVLELLKVCLSALDVNREQFPLDKLYLVLIICTVKKIFSLFVITTFFSFVKST